MTLPSANIPEFWVIGFYIAVATTVFTGIGVVVFLWGRQPTQKDQAELYQIHERMAHLAESTTIPDKKAA